jgi:hypothetical protein
MLFILLGVTNSNRKEVHMRIEKGIRTEVLA